MLVLHVFECTHQFRDRSIGTADELMMRLLAQITVTFRFQVYHYHSMKMSGFSAALGKMLPLKLLTERFYMERVCYLNAAL